MTLPLLADGNQVPTAYFNEVRARLKQTPGTPLVANTNLTQEDRVKLVSGAVTLTLPSPSGAYPVTIKKIDAGTSTTIAANAAETIDGEASLVLSEQDDTVTLVSDGTNWHIAAYYNEVRGRTQAVSQTPVVLSTPTTLTQTQTRAVVSGAGPYTLPTAVGAEPITFKKTDAGTITEILPDGAETIDGQPALYLPDIYDAATLMPSGGNWFII